MKEETKIEELNGMELLKLIYEEVKNNREEIQSVKKELNEKFNYLDKKIDNKINSLVAEISEEFKTFYEVSEKRIINLEEKIDSEIEDRKVDISKIKEFNRIIINDIRGRVSILEEETEKYNLK